MHNGENKRCLAACEGQSYQVTASSSLFPVPNTFNLAPYFCSIVRKIEHACNDERKITLELVYPNICEDIETVMNNDACRDTYKPEKITDWTYKKGAEFSELILRYARENIVKVNVYIKDPFAVKFLIEENASK